MTLSTHGLSSTTSHDYNDNFKKPNDIDDIVVILPKEESSTKDKKFKPLYF